jgi:prepilin peptidase CpaA
MQSITVILLTLFCAVTDFRSGKIYNKVTYPAAILGLAASFILAPPTPLMSVAGFFGALAGYSMLRRVGGIGAGDVKLMAAVGALKGLPFVFYASFYIFCVGSFAGIIILAYQRRLLPTLKWVAGTLVSTVIPGMSAPRMEGGMSTMPFGPAIFLGTTFCVALEYFYQQQFTF